MEQFYLYLSSTDSLKYYPNNVGYDFKIQLPQTFHVSQEWECALVVFAADPKLTSVSSKDIYVFCDLIEESYVRDSSLPIIGLLRYLSKRQYEHDLFIDHLEYHRLSRNSFDTVHIYIKDSDLQNIAELTGFVRCTLHFRKQQ